MNPNTLGLQFFVSIVGFVVPLTAAILISANGGSEHLAFWLYGAAAAWPTGRLSWLWADYRSDKKSLKAVRRQQGK